MGKYQFALFDLDGTIADTSKGVVNCVKYAEKKLNLPRLDESVYRKFIGPPNAVAYHNYYGLTGERLDMAVKYHALYALKKGVYEVQEYAGIRRILDYLKNKGYRIAVATLKKQEAAEKVLRYLGLYGYFDMIAGDEGKGESKKDLLLKCLNRTNIARERAVLIGDSEYDQGGAADSGIDFIGVLYGFGFGEKADLQYFPYSAVAADTDELYKILKERTEQ